MFSLFTVYVNIFLFPAVGFLAVLSLPGFQWMDRLSVWITRVFFFRLVRSDRPMRIGFTLIDAFALHSKPRLLGGFTLFSLVMVASILTFALASYNSWQYANDYRAIKVGR